MALDERSDTVPPSAGRPVTVTPPPEVLGLWRAFRVARKNILEIIPEASYRERVVHDPKGRWRMLTDPDAIAQVFKAKPRAYPRSEVVLRILRPREGDSLFTADWDEWRWQHRAMTPVFQHRNLLNLSAVMTRSAEATSQRFAARSGEVVDVYDEMITATFDVINDTAFSGRESLDRDQMSDGVARFIDAIARLSLLDILGVPRWVPRPGRLFSTAVRDMDRMMDAVIAQRLANGPHDKPDLLDLLIAAEDPDDGRKMTPAELRNNLLAFVVAGHETTALALTWALYLLAIDPAAQAKARDEAQTALGDRAATADDLPALSYVRQVVDEALRLYPPAAFLARNVLIHDEILGRPVRPNETIFIPVYALHRNRLYWDDPDAFAPERFAPEAVRARPRYAYLPFGAGPRVCIGMGFALMEATLILATLIARHRVEAVAETRPKPELVFTLRPSGGMPLKITRL